MNPVLTHIPLHVRDLEACITFYQSYTVLHLIHDRRSDGKRVVWHSEKGRETTFILVLLPGGPGRNQVPDDFSQYYVPWFRNTSRDQEW